MRIRRIVIVLVCFMLGMTALNAHHYNGTEWVSDYGGEDEQDGKEDSRENNNPTTDDDKKNTDDNPTSEDNEEARKAAEEAAAREAERIRQLAEDIKNLEERLSAEENKNTNTAAMSAMQQRFSELNRQLEDSCRKFAEYQAKAAESRNAEKNRKNSGIDGDPVRVTVGYYEQDETDLTVGGIQHFEVKRQYSSGNTFATSFGYGWSTNLDQRIILGTAFRAAQEYGLFLEDLNQRQKIIDDLQQEIISCYKVSSIENGVKEITEHIELYRSLEEEAQRIAKNENTGDTGINIETVSGQEEEEEEETPSDSQTGGAEGQTVSGSGMIEEEPITDPDTDSEDSGITEGGSLEAVTGRLDKLPDESELRAKAEIIAEEAHEKAVNEERILSAFIQDVALLHQMQAEYDARKRETNEFYINTVVPSEERKTRNRHGLFEGMDSDYDGTGLDTVIVMDENGYPHLLYEITKGSSVWENSNEKIIVKCEASSGGYIVTERDGTVKEFDGNGFITRIIDRNGNFIEIKRKPDEKIECIENSSGEKYDFEYSGKLISKIINAHSPDENVIYGYSGNRLVSVKDIDGDTVTMSYDLDGRMISLNKCDGSSVCFEYGEQTADGLVLTTATTNEEGYAEHFEYYRSQRRTDYIDHDGNRTSYWYDQRHRTVKEIRPDRTVITNEYDDFDNLIRTNENGNITSFSYDRTRNKIAAVYNDGSTENWTYDDFGKITSYTDRDGVREEYICDEKGNVTEYRRDGRAIYSQQFDSKGLVTRRIVYGENPLVTDYEYDVFGNLISETCGGVKTEYEYDKRGRIIKIITGGKLLRQFEYDGHKTTYKDWNGLETVFVTNGRKDLVEVSQKDNVTSFERKSRIEYDRRHLPLKVYEGDGENEVLTKGYSYTAEGKIKSEILYGDENWVREYEYKNGIISEVRQYKTSAVVESAQSAGIETTEVFTQKYNYQIQNGNKKLLTVTDGLGGSSLFEYDSYGNLVKATDANGEVSQRRYTKSGLLNAEQTSYGGWYEYGYTDGIISSAKEQGGAAAFAEYYPDGSLKSETDRYGKVTYYSYDSRGRVTGIQSEARKIWYEYDNFDRVTKQIVGNSKNEASAVYYVTYEYSENGRSVTVTEGGKYKTVYELDAFGNVIKHKDGNNNERSFVYDNQNQLTESYDGYGNKTSYEYNALGEISKVTLPDGTVTKYEYNYMGLLEKVTDACGTVYTASYDKAGRLLKERERGDAEKTYEYDSGGRITKVLCGGETVESYSYANNNRTLTVKDGNGEAYIYSYDGFGRLTNEKNRNGNEQNYFYDADGKLKSRNDFTGSSTTITYSSDRTVRTVIYSDGSENRFVYDAIGNITEAQNAYGKTVYRYDQGSRMIYQKDSTTGEEVYFEYDDAGNRTRLLSTNRETIYSYGKNNEVKEIFDNKQRISIKLEYNKIGQETVRRFGNGTKEETLYDDAGRVTVKMQKSDRGEFLWGEGYAYGEDGKRTATVDNLGRVTLYEYNSKGQLATVYYPYTDEMVRNLKEEAQLNGLPTTADAGENRYLSSEIRASLIPLLNSMQYGLSYNLTNLHIFIKESYLYDKNGNRKSKTTPYGTIEYTYDKENCLISSSSNGQSYVNYTYDAMGNLLTEESAGKITKYAYNSQNRLIYCEVTDRANKEYGQTTYAYDAFGRRVLVQDKGEAALRTLYDGLTFDVIKQSPTFQNGMFTDSNETGIRWGKTGKPTGDRYRYISDEETQDSNRYFYLDDGTYKTVSSRYRGERTQLTVNGTLAAQSTSDYGAEYFSTDLLGSVRTTTDSYGTKKSGISYDAFGSLVEGDLSGASDFGYLGKQQDPTSRLYNYGYRDYNALTSRFTTLDPIRDGTNWFSYCNGDPVNFVDIIGLIISNFNAYYSMSKYSDSINGTNSNISSSGCAMTGMADIITEQQNNDNPNQTASNEETHTSSAKGVTPQDINIPENFYGNTDELDWNKTASHYGLTAKRSVNKQDALRMLKQASESKESVYILIQVPITIGKDNTQKDLLHWVGYTGKEFMKGGEKWLEIIPTSDNDAFRDKKNANWMIKDGKIYVRQSAIEGVVAVSKKNK